MYSTELQAQIDLMRTVYGSFEAAKSAAIQACVLSSSFQRYCVNKRLNNLWTIDTWSVARQGFEPAYIA